MLSHVMLYRKGRPVVPVADEFDYETTFGTGSRESS